MKPAGLQAGLCKNGLESPDGVEGAGDDAELRRIERGEIDAIDQEIAQRAFRGTHRQHGAGFALLHQPAAMGDQPQGILEAEHARDRSRRQFADAVAYHPRRNDAALNPELCRRIFRQEKGRLRDLRIPQRPRGVRPLDIPADQGADVETEHRFEDIGALVDPVRESRIAAIKTARHARILRPLARKQEDHARRLVSGHPFDCRRGSEPANSIRRALTHEGCAVRKGMPSVLQRVGNVFHCEVATPDGLRERCARRVERGLRTS